MADQDYLEEAKDLLSEANGIMNSVAVAILEFHRSGFFGRRRMTKRLDHLRQRIYAWQDRFYNSDLISPSPPRHPAQHRR